MAALSALSTAIETSKFVPERFQSPQTSGSIESVPLGATGHLCFYGKPLRLAGRPPYRPQSRASHTINAVFGSPRMAIVDEKEDDVVEDWRAGAEDVVSTSTDLLETVNAVFADVVDYQKFQKATGRRSPKPMNRRALVVSLALGAIRPCRSDIEESVGHLRRTTSASLAKTCHLVSQLSLGASRAVSYQLAELGAAPGTEGDSLAMA